MKGLHGNGAAPPWRIGESVPWSVAWSGETAFALRPSRDFPGMTEVGQVERPGVGEPLFAAVHVDRHRRGMVGHLCHVCGRPTARHDRWMFPVASGGFVTLHDGTLGYGCNVPPLHRACARLAAARCPHLTRLAEAPTPCPAEAGRLIYRTDVPPGMEALAATFPPGLEVVFSCYRLFGPAFTRRVQRLRAAWDRATLARRRESLSL
ncbi:MAG: hypothetical protein ACR2FH_00500 [Caulobacteraceae bacterium]